MPADTIDTPAAQIDPAALQESLRVAAGRSPEALTDAVIDVVGSIAAAARRGVVGSAGQAQAIEEIRSLSKAAQAAAIEAKRNAMPPGTDAEAVRAYQASPYDGDIGVHTVELGKGRVDSSRQYLRVGEHTPIRMVGGWVGDGADAEYREGYLTDPNPRSEGQKVAQQLAADLALVESIRSVGGRKATGRIARRKFMRHLTSLPGFSRMFADNAGEGAEWQPDVQGTRLLEYMALPREVAGLFRTVPATDGMTNPFLISGLQPYAAGGPALGDLDPANLQASQIGTGELTYNVYTLAVTTLGFRDAAEDSILAFAPTMRMALAQALLDAREDAILNGDTGAHGDTGIDSWTAGGRWTAGSDADHRKMFVGLRHRALGNTATADFDGSNISTDFLKLHGKLTKGFSRTSLVGITSLEALIYHFLVDSNFLTVDKIGVDRSTLRTGQVGQVGGVPLVISEFMSAEMNTSGVFDNSTKTQTGLVLCDTSRIVRPVRRAARTETEIEAKKHVVYITASDREGLTFECQSTEDPVAYGYDIASST